MDAEGFPHTAPGCRVEGGGSLTVEVSSTGGLVVVMGHWLVDGGGGTGGLVVVMGHWLVDGGFTKLRFRGAGDLVEVVGHGIGGWRSFAAQAGPLRRAVWREDCRCGQCHSRIISCIFLFIK